MTTRKRIGVGLVVLSSLGAVVCFAVAVLGSTTLVNAILYVAIGLLGLITAFSIAFDLRGLE